jgi:hypothetical protein
MSSNNAFSTSRGAANESAGKENGAPDDTIKPGNSSSTRGIVQEDATYDKNQETRALARDLSCRLDAVDEIRTILVAAAQNLGVKLPRKALSDADMELLKPKEHAYDQTQVIDYLLEVYLLNEQVGYLFFTPREGRKLEYDKLPGYQCVFSWDLPVYDHNRLIMHELGYDSNGYVCRLPTGSSDASCHVCRLPTRSNTSYHVHERIVRLPLHCYNFTGAALTV